MLAARRRKRARTLSPPPYLCFAPTWKALQKAPQMAHLPPPQGNGLGRKLGVLSRVRAGRQRTKRLVIKLAGGQCHHDLTLEESLGLTASYR